MTILADQVLAQADRDVRKLGFMKLAGRDAARYFAKPDPGKTGLIDLWRRSDAHRSAPARGRRGASWPRERGRNAADAHRGAELRKDPALLLDAMKARGFFEGPRVVLVEDAGEGLAETVTVAMSDWQPGDAQIVVTAGTLNARSGLRKHFEGHSNALAVGIYDDPPSREEVEATLKAAGLGPIDSDGMADIQALSRMLDPGDFKQTIEKLALYKIGDETPVGARTSLPSPPLRPRLRSTMFSTSSLRHAQTRSGLSCRS